MAQYGLRRIMIIMTLCLLAVSIATILALRPIASLWPNAGQPRTLPGGLLQPATKTGNLKIGRTMPDLKITRLDGQVIDLSRMINRSGLTLVTFISLGCPPCLEEVRTIKRYWTELRALDVKVICISNEGTEHLNEFVKNERLPFEVFNDPNGEGMKRICGLPGTPYHVILEPNTLKVQWLINGNVKIKNKENSYPMLMLYLRQQESR